MSTLTKPRASCAASCARQAVYEAIATDKDELPEDRQRYLYGGKVTGIGIAMLEYPDAEHEVECETHGVTGTADVWLAKERRVVEIKSSVGLALQDYHVTQVRIYALALNARSAAVHLYDPVARQSRVVEVEIGDPLDIIARLRVITDALSTKRPRFPKRVCEHPGDSPSFFCPYVSTCFADHKLPELEQLWDAEDAVSELHDLRERKANKGRQDALKDYLRSYVKAGVEYTVGEFIVKRTEGKPSRRFDLTAFEKAGHKIGSADPEVVEKFVQVSERETWKIKVLEAA